MNTIIIIVIIVSTIIITTLQDTLAALRDETQTAMEEVKRNSI
jgi:hypothetical protein